MPSIGGIEVHLERPWVLLLLVMVALVAKLVLERSNTVQGSFWFSRCKELVTLRPGWVARWSRLPLLLRLVALSLIVVALANPKIYTDSVQPAADFDIMFILDLSQSMEEMDGKRSRLETGQRTITEFLEVRTTDRMGLVVFAEQTMLSCPLTLDHESLGAIVDELQIGDVSPLGTAIGDALGVALASLLRAEGKSKVVILLSDGAWNKAHSMGPGEARDLAARMGVRVFSVLLGHEKNDEKAQHGVNPQVLKTLARQTRGLYFNAENENQLGASFDKIHAELLKTPAKRRNLEPGRPIFTFFLWPALALLLLELLLRMTRFRSFP